MSRYEKYPAYRDFGVEWIGEIPGHWEVKQTRHIFKIYSGSTPKSGEALFWDGDITWFTPDDLGNNQQKNISESRRKITEEGYKSCGTSLAKTNSIVFSTRAPIGHIALSTVSACCNQGCRILEPENGNTDYWYYTLVSAKPILQSLGQGSTFMELPRQSLASFNLPFPPLEEQQAIASFLDRKTAQIDELITKKEELLKKLDEKRTALITRAVTKGLDPSAPMKESGVEWLGEIPKHWVIWKVTHGFNTIGSGTTPKSDNSDFYDGNIPWVTTSELRETVIENTSQKISIDAFQSYSALKIYPTGSIVIAMYGATIGRLGILGVDATVNQACCVFAQPTTFEPRFFYYWLLMRKPILISLSTGGGQPNLSLEDLKNIRIPTPPLEEQQAIAEHIEKKTATIDRQKAQVTEAIERLKEYRTALITDAVTGKMDVQLHEKTESLSA